MNEVARINPRTASENYILNGGPGDDVLNGGSGDDILNGFGGNDGLNGGPGDDVLNGGLGTDYLNGGDGANDTAAYTGLTSAVTVSLAVTGAQDTGGGGIDTLWYIENLTGTNYADTLTGNARANRLDGGAGADTLTGGAGNDTFWVNLRTDLVVEAPGGGTDTVHATDSYALSDNVEKLILEGTRNISASGNALANILTGNAGNNVLDGGTGADRMAGGLGNDTYHVDNAGDVVIEAVGGGTDSVLSSITFTLTGETENLTLTGTAAIDGTGNNFANTLTGNALANELHGVAGADTLKGGAGADSLDGGAGNDVLIGGSGADTLTGGYNADTFRFLTTSDTPMAQRDTIEDFHHAQLDHIDLSAIDAIAGGADDAFTLTDAFHHVAGELIVTTVASDHYLVRGDTDGDGIANFGIDVFSLSALSAGDFVL